MHANSDHDDEEWEVIDEIELEQVIRDFITLGREFLKILRDLINIDEGNDPPIEA